jgi:tetratricopeptide (TPR) repeat protein
VSARCFRRVVALLAIAATVCACRTALETPPPPLPNLDAMAAPVQEQIRAQYEQLTSTRAAPASPSTRAAEIGGVGVLLMAAESAAAAEPFLSQAIRLDPNEPRWPYNQGHQSRMKGDSAAAAAHFERVLTLRPDDVPSLVWLANVTLDQGRTDDAAALYERALARQPGRFAARGGLGRAALAGGKASLAVTRLEAASAAEPRATAVNYPLAMAYRQVGRLDEAEARLRARGDAQPPLPAPLMRELAEILRSPVVYESRGDRALAAGQPAAAVDAVRQALALAPDRRAITQKLATSLAITGDVRAAVTLYQELLAQDPDFPEAHYSLGALFAGSGQLSLAIDQFAAAVRGDPGYLQARLQLGHTLRRARAFDRALAAYRGALSVDPRFVEARLGYAVTLVEAGHYGTARVFLTEGLRQNPARLEFMELLVRVLAAAPDVTVRDGAKAAGLGAQLVRQTRTWRTLEAWAMALAETGQWTEAVARQREALDAFRRATGTDSPRLADTLRRFERRQPCRKPWSGDPLS